MGIIGQAFALEHHRTLAIVLTTAIVLSGGVLAQVLGRAWRLPAMLFLLAFGIGLGPEGLGVIRPEIYGGGLRAIVSIAVAVIVFEGAHHIDVRHLGHVSRSVAGLVTVGAGVTCLLAMLTAHWLVGLPWKISLLFGAMVSVTGPTVVTPIVKRLPLTRRLKTTLEAEGVLVEDMGSANGTYINDKRTQSGLLKPGEELRLDTVRFLLTTPNMDARGQSAARGAAETPPAPAAARRKMPWIVLVVVAIVLAAIAFAVAGYPDLR